jgi:ribosomal protein S18 acetylase RimI-like enzyme
VNHTVRPACVDDAWALACLYSVTLVDAYAGISLPDTALIVDCDHRAERFRTTMTDGSRCWLVSTHDNAIVGFCGLASARDLDLSGTVGEVTTIAVDQSHRHRGHGRALLLAAAQLAVGQGWFDLVLWVVTTNVAARTFYERLGFVADGSKRVDSRLGAAVPIMRYRASMPVSL